MMLRRLLLFVLLVLAACSLLSPAEPPMLVQADYRQCLTHEGEPLLDPPDVVRIGKHKNNGGVA